MFQLEIAVDVIPMVMGGNKYVANCGAAGERKRVDDFAVKGISMRDLFVSLIEKMDDLNIPEDCEMNIVGEFNLNDLSEDDKRIWAKPLNEIRKHLTGLNRFLSKLSN